MTTTAPEHDAINQLVDLRRLLAERREAALLDLFSKIDTGDSIKLPVEAAFDLQKLIAATTDAISWAEQQEQDSRPGLALLDVDALIGDAG